LWGGVNSPEPAWTHRGEPLPQMPDVTTPEQQAAVEAADPMVVAPLYRVNLDDPAAPPEAVIPVERMRGPVLLISGEDDAMWPSSRMGEQVDARMAAHGRSSDVTHLRYRDAGHLIGNPYLPTTVSDRRHPVLGIRFAYGGTPAGSARANADSWPRVLDFLRDAL
jgi:dienelactone hydrolase